MTFSFFNIWNLGRERQLGLEEENVDMWHFTVRVGLKEENVTVRVGLKEENVRRERKSLKEESLRVSERKRMSVEESAEEPQQPQRQRNLSAAEISRPLIPFSLSHCRLSADILFL